MWRTIIILIEISQSGLKTIESGFPKLVRNLKFPFPIWIYHFSPFWSSNAVSHLWFQKCFAYWIVQIVLFKFFQIYPITAHWFPLSIGYLIMKFGNFPPNVRHFVESRLSKPGFFIFCTCQSIVMLGTTLCFWFFENHSLSIFCVFQHI